MVAQAAAALLSSEALTAGTKLAGDVIAQISAALNMSILSMETVRTTKRAVQTTRFALPAWLVVGGAVGLWILGLGLTVKTNSQGKGIFAWTERPRITLPFAPQAGGQASQGFIPDWVPFLGQF